MNRRQILQVLAAFSLVPLASSNGAVAQLRKEKTMLQLNYRHVEVNGLRMRIADHGEGPAVLLCHGFPETAYAWRHQLHALANAGYRAIAPDLRGFGGTSAPTDIEDYALQRLVGDMIGLLDVLQVDTAVIVGNDWGATLAWQAALLRPDRFRAVAAIGVPLMGQPPVAPTQIFPQTDEAWLYTLYFQDEGVAEAEFEADIHETLLKIYFGASSDAGPRGENHDTPNPFGMVQRGDGLLTSLPLPQRDMSWLSDEDLEVFVENYRQSGFRGGLNLYRNLDRNWALQAAFSGMTVNIPAIYMVGTHDTGLAIPGMRQMIETQTALAPKLKAPIFIEDCGHWAPQEKPGQVSEILTTFLAELGDLDQ